MSKPGIARKSSSKKTAPKPLIVVTGKNAFGWLLSLFVVCGCMFVIGILVGRGQAPVQFDTHEWEQDLKNLKTSVLAKREEIRDSIGHIEILDYLKEKGKSIQFYKQYIPPVLSPKYGKYAPSPGITPVAGESSAPDQPVPQQATDRSMQNSRTSFLSPDLADQASQGRMRTAESVKKDDDQTASAADDRIAVKTPATSKPSTNLDIATSTNDSGPSNAGSDTDAAHDNSSFSSFAGIAADMPAKGLHADSSPSGAATTQPVLQYAIQVASLQEPDKAAAVRDKFRSRGYPAYCQSSKVRGVTWHRVRIGPYPDRHTADQDHLRLKEVGVDAMVFVLEQ